MSGIDMRVEKIVSTVDKMHLLYSKDFYEWPDAWMGFDEDLITGKTILQAFTPFVKNLGSSPDRVEEKRPFFV